MHDVFISYSTKNTVIADAVCNRLEAGGVRCWYAPRDVQAGKGFAGELIRAIRKAKVFLLIYSKDYNQSKQVLSELTEAVDASCTIVPFRVDQSDMNDDLAFYLKKIHWLDAINPPTQNQIEVLYKHVANILGLIPPGPSDLEEERRRKEEERRRTEEEERKRREEEERARKERLKKLLLKVVLPVAVVVCLCVVGGWLLWSRDSGPKPKPDVIAPQETEQTSAADSMETAETQPDANPQKDEAAQAAYPTIHFENLSRLSQYENPFLSTSMLSFNGEYIVLKDKESETYTIRRTDNSAVYLTGLELSAHKDLRRLALFMEDGYDTIYFVDYDSERIAPYDRTQREWLNMRGIRLELSDTEYIHATCAYTENMLEDNIHDEEIGVLIYDTDPAVDCISKQINISPDGGKTVHDLSQYGLVDIVSGVNRPGYCATLMVDKNRSLRVLDDYTGEVLDLSHEELIREYLPYAGEDDVICEDNRYYLTNDNRSVQIWDLYSGNRIYSRTFADYAYVRFSAPYEMIVFNDEDDSVFVRDLETGRETVLMDQAYFESQPIFMEGVFDFQYSREHDVCVFAVANYLKEGQTQGHWRIVVTDREGNILGASDELITHNGGYSCSLVLLDNMLLADMTLVDWDTAEPEDGTVSELFFATFSVDQAGNLVFQ